MSEGIAFSQMAPPREVTDPRGLGLDAEYPKHLHKAGAADDGGPLYVEVRSAPQEADAIAEGWLLEKPGRLAATSAPSAASAAARKR